MSRYQRVMAQVLSIVLAFSTTLAPVAAQTADELKAARATDSSQGSVNSQSYQTSTKSKAQTSLKRSEMKSAAKKRVVKGATPRSVLQGKDKTKKAKLSDIRSVGGVGGVSGYPPLLIGPGDVLAIAVYGEEELPLEYQVDATGIITYPYLGNVYLGGMTPAEASEKMARLLAKPRKVTVLIKESNTYWVSVMGHVGKPGKYQIRGKPTLLSALAEAGGPLPGAKLGSAIIIHKGYKTKANLNNFLSGTGEIGPEPLLYPGDALVVPKSGMPSMGEIAIVASIFASLAVVAVELNGLKKK